MKPNVRSRLIFLLAFILLSSVMPVSADDITSLESQTNTLQSQLNGINQDLLSISNEIASTESQIEDANNEMLRIQDSLAISRENEERQYESMKIRIKYMYENDNSSFLEMLFSADNMTEFLNRADFIENVSNYDHERLTALQEVKTGIEEQEASLKEKQSSLNELQAQLVTQQAELTAKAEETSTDLAEFNKQLQALREEEARKAEEAKKASEAVASAASNSDNTQSGNTSSSGTNGNSGSNTAGGSNGSYNYPTSGGALTPEKGVVYFNGHRETYYSQKVLPGGGLNIPGRHVAEDGTIRDADGYICVASSDLPWGTIVETSLGTGKVYDCGCASGTIDIYTDW